MFSRINCKCMYCKCMNVKFLLLTNFPQDNKVLLLLLLWLLLLAAGGVRGKRMYCP